MTRMQELGAVEMAQVEGGWFWFVVGLAVGEVLAFAGAYIVEKIR